MKCHSNIGFEGILAAQAMFAKKEYKRLQKDTLVHLLILDDIGQLGRAADKSMPDKMMAVDKMARQVAVDNKALQADLGRQGNPQLELAVDQRDYQAMTEIVLMPL